VDERSQDLERVIKDSSHFDMIVGINTSFTQVIDKIKPKGILNDKKIIGFDNVPDNIRALQDGTLHAVLAQRQDIFAQVAIKCIYEHSNHNTIRKIENLDTYEINKISIKQ
jgi:methyl-accepting chemotaxis protein